MLRIMTERDGNSYRLELHGTVGGEGIGVLERHWLSILDEAPSALITVGLANVAFIDPHGEQLLRRMTERGIEFEVAGCMNRYVIEKISAVESGKTA